MFNECFPHAKQKVSNSSISRPQVSSVCPFFIVKLLLSRHKEEKKKKISVGTKTSLV